MAKERIHVIIFILAMVSVTTTAEAALWDSCTTVGDCGYSGATCFERLCGCDTAGGYRMEGNQCLPNAPTVSVSGPTQSGTSLTIVCTAGVTADSPAITAIQWTKDSTAIDIAGSNGKYSGGSVSTPSLTITSITTTDRGDYRCTATNPVGSTTSTSAVTLAPPTVSVTGPSSVLYGNGVTFTGIVTSNLPWTAQKWQKGFNNGTVLAIDINGEKYTGSSLASLNPKLKIINTDFTDEAKYQLDVSNGVGSMASNQVSLDVTGDVPTVSITENSTAVFGSTLGIYGTITSNPAVTSVTWQKVDGSQTVNLDISNQKYSRSYVSFSSPELVINDANFNDKAIYQLAVTNLVGTRTSNKNNLTVTGEKPTITINPSSASVSVVYGKTATLTATVTTTSDSPPAAVNGAWQKKMSGTFTDIDITDEKYKDSVNDVSGPVLKINSAVYTDEGAYRFTASNLVGLTVSSAKTLDVTGTKPTVAISANPSSSIQFGTTLNITATVTANPPANTTRWQRKPLNGSWSNISISDSMYAGSSVAPGAPSLVIASITYGKDNVAFRCVVGNVEGETTSNEITIDVTGNLLSVSVAPRGTVPLPYNVTLTPTMVAIVTAGSNTEPAQEVRWRKISSGNVETIDISSSKYSGSTLLPNPQLVISNAIFGDEAEYQCQARNDEGWGSSNKVSIDVTGGVVTVTIGSDVTGKIGESVTISCTVTGPEISQITWKKGGADLSIDGTKYTGSTTNSPSLIINYLVLQDAGQYQCTASNRGGTYGSPDSATLTVKNRQFQDVCSASLPCDYSKELECSQSTGRCVCKGTFYHNNNLCYPRYRLKATFTSHSSSTSTFSVSWTPPSNDVNLVSGYVVKWRIHNQAVSTHQSQTVGQSVTSHTVNTELIPGQLYIVAVTSSVTLTNPASNIEVYSDVKLIRIVPLQSGVIVDSSNFASDRLMLSWSPPINGTVVTKYDVTIAGTTQSTVDSNANIQFTKQLIPGTKYNVSIVTVSGQNINRNEEKRSVAYTEEIRTTPTKPGPPTGVTCPAKPKDKSLEISWTAPTAPNGRVVKYIILVSGAVTKTVDTLSNVNTFDVTGLLENRSYTFAVKTVNDAVNSTSSESGFVTCITIAGLPTPPTALTIGSPSSRGFPVSFSVPNDVKGQLAGYRILINDDSKCWQQIKIICNSCTEFTSASQSCDTSIVHRVSDIAVTQNYDVTGLHPYINYTVEAAAINGVGIGYSVDKTTMTEEEVPQKPSISSVAPKSDKEVYLTWSLAPPSPGNVTYTVTVMEAEDNTSNVFINKREIQYNGFEDKVKVIDDLEEFWRYKFTVTATTIKGSQISEESAVIRTKQGVPGKVRDLTVVRKPNTYQAALVQWKVPLLRDQNGILVNYRFISNATGSSDKLVPVNTNEQIVTEEEINVVIDMIYSIEIYAINSEGTTGEKYAVGAGLRKDPQSTSSVGVIVGSIAGVIIVITALVIAIFIWRRKRSELKQDSKTYADLTLHDRGNSDQTYSTLDQRTRIQREKPIPLHSFIDHVLDLMKDSRLKICNEFSELLRSTETSTTTKATLKMNTHRNRGSVVPYDFNRVQLQEKREGSDYINASFVLNQSYIMAQYPLPKTAGHFWRMVWEQNCSSIVALTIDDEKYKEEWYFPASDGAVRTVGGIDVELVVTFDVLEKVTLRKIKLSKGKQLKNVNHIHAYGLGMVNMSEQLLHLTNLVKANNAKIQNNGPYVVHGGCVGIDYSGVFVLVDYLVKLIESGVNRIDVYGSTFTIMSERMDALITEEQYAVIYMCLKTYINNKARSGNHNDTIERKDAASTYEYLP